MSKHKVNIGAGDWFWENPRRFGIYNSNYIGYFDKEFSRDKPWAIAAPSGHEALGKRFETHKEATDYVREELSSVST